MRKFIAILIAVLSGCSDESASKRNFVDPISGQSTEFVRSEIPGWELYTLPDSPGGMILVAQNGKPVVSITNGQIRSVFVHRTGSGLAATVQDRDGDGAYDDIDYGDGKFLLMDHNFDGWPDSRGEGSNMLAWIDNGWHTLRSDGNGGHTIEIDGQSISVRLEDGSWTR